MSDALGLAERRTGWRLQNKLLAGILLVELLLMSTVILLVEQQLRDTLSGEFLRHGLSTTRSLAAVNVDFVTTYNYVKLDQHLQQALRDPDLLYATVQLFDGEIASHAGRADLRDAATPERNLPHADEQVTRQLTDDVPYYDISVPIISAGVTWGAVRTGLSLQSLQQAIAAMRYKLFSLGGLGLLLAYLASTLLARRITRPIQTLMASVEAVTAGQFDRPIDTDINSNDEIGYLSRQFAAMQATVKEQFELLESANDDLSASNLQLQHEIEERQQKERALQQEITERQKKQAELKANKTRLANAQRIAKLGYWEWHRNAPGLLWSAQLNVLLGGDEGEPLRRYRDLLRCVHPDDKALLKTAVRRAVHDASRQSIEHRVFSVGGEHQLTIQHEIEATFDTAGQLESIVGTLQDISERKTAEERVRYLAHYDSVTGLPNRRHLENLLNLWLQRANRNGQMLAVMFLDIDHFKRVNDTLGHDAGDALLRQVAQRLTQGLRAERPDRTQQPSGGRELGRPAGRRRVRDRAGRHRQPAGRRRGSATPYASKSSLDRFPLPPTEVVVTPSIGISCYPQDGNEPSTLLKHADMAMYHAKEKGRNNYQFFAASMNAYLQERLTLESCLRDSLHSDHFSLRYQPKIDLKTGAVVGMEALLRWHHPELGPVSPDKFIPIAEETGLIVPLGEWVLRAACAQLGAWCAGLDGPGLDGADGGRPPLCIAVNLSAAQFRHQRLASTVTQILRDTGLAPSQLELELTESMLMEQIEASVPKLNELKATGVTLSVDDFGTGYSSLNYLKRFPIDRLKIDQSFIRELAVDPNDAAIVTATISLGHALGLSVVAEGVENETQYQFLRQHGCDQLQGYYLSTPLTADEFAAFYHRHRADAPLGEALDVVESAACQQRRADARLRA